MSELISIIVPVYNTKKYLEKCVDSILIQTYPFLEILLVDDGSIDGSGELCDEIAKKDQRIQVFHQKNAGSSAARNFAIKNAEGSYLGFVDSDDTVEPDMYERLYEAIKKYEVDIAQIGRDEIDEEGNILPVICETPDFEEVISKEMFMEELLFHRGDCSFCTKLVKKELFQEEIFPIGILNEDFHLLVKMLLHTDRIVSLPSQAYHVLYRMGSNTRVKQGFSRVYFDNISNADMVSMLVDQYYPDLKLVAIRFGFVQRLDYLLHIPMNEMNVYNKNYVEIVSYVRKNTKLLLSNQYITQKQKLYLCLLGWMPKVTRKIHGITMKLRKGWSFS